MIEQGVKDVYTSDNFRNYLSMLSKFHNYSFNNVMLILSQYPSASLIAGYSKWQNEFNRQVNKGEKAIKILAPYQVDLKKLLDDIDDNGNSTQVETTVKVTRFRVVNVFDVNQTVGEPLPELIYDLQGTSFNARALIESIQFVSKIPIEMISGNEDVDLANGAKGYYSVTEDKIVVNKDLDDIQIAKTLTHEYAHSILHKDTKKERNQREIEAESLAFVICNYFGIDTSEYSFGYIASYSQQETEKLKQILQNIQVNAKEMIQLIEPVFKTRLTDLQIENKYFSPVEMENMSKELVQKLVEEIKKTELYEQIKNVEPCDISYAKESVDIEINEMLYGLSEKYPLQVALYGCNQQYRYGLGETVFQYCYQDEYDEKQMHPFLERSIERRNYLALEKMAKPVLEGEAYYMKMQSKEFMDFNVERIVDDRLAISHYGELNGDAMADPDVMCRLDEENKLLIPETFQNDYVGVYQTTEEDPKLTDDLSNYMQLWFSNIEAKKYKVSRICSNEKNYSMEDNPKELMRFCKENGIQKYVKKEPEKDER